MHDSPLRLTRWGSSRSIPLAVNQECPAHGEKSPDFPNRLGRELPELVNDYYASVMREERTADENRILGRIDVPLKLLKLGEWTIDPTVTDAPDIVLTQDRSRLGIEITRLDYQEHCHWRHLTGKGPYSRAAEVTIDLEKLLGAVSKNKWGKYAGYKTGHDLNECWLILFNDAFEFKEQAKAGNPDRRWFEKFARLTLQDLKCPYDRVWFNLTHPNRWYHIYKKSDRIYRDAKITRWPSIILKEVSVNLKGSDVAEINFSDIEHRKTFE